MGGRLAAGLVTAIVLLVVVGSMGSGIFFLLAMVAVVLVGVGFLASRSKDNPRGPQSVITHEGIQWMKDSNGNFLRWDSDAHEWKQSAPPAPEAIRKFDAASAVRDAPGWRGARSALVVTVTVIVIIGLGLWAALDPYVQIPIVSKAVCNLKGASWQQGSSFLGVPPGCYSRPSNEGSFFEQSEAESEPEVSSQGVLEATLKNAATAQESYAIGNNGQYTYFVEDLADQGLVVPEGIYLEVRDNGSIRGPGSYCMEASDGVGVYFYDSEIGTPLEGSCHIGD